MAENTKKTSQYLDNESYNETYGMYEHIAYGDNGDGTVSAQKTDKTADYGLYGSTSDATYDYIGYQNTGGKWYIMRVNGTSGDTTYAVGSSGMATAWSSFATQDYDVWANHHPE